MNDSPPPFEPLTDEEVERLARMEFADDPPPSGASDTKDAGQMEQKRAALAAEQAVLGSLMIDAGVARIVSRRLCSLDFEHAAHQAIYQAIYDIVIAKGNPDPVTVGQRLADKGLLKAAGDMRYIGGLVLQTPNAANADQYARLVQERSIKRQLSQLGRDMAADAVNGDLSAEEILASFAPRMRAVQADIEDRGDVRALEIPAASTWKDKAPPPPREWIWQDIIPAGRVSSFYGEGGLGKTTIALQIAVHAAAGRQLYGAVMRPTGVLGIFCEDEQEELEKRARAAASSSGIDLAELSALHVLSRDGHDNLLCTYNREHIEFTDFYRQLDATIGRLRPGLVILDTAADLYGGDFMSTPQVRQFLKVGLGGLSVRHGCAVLLLAHPSASGIASGDGGGYSVAWHNSVRSRIYLRRPKGDAEAIQDRRVLEQKKSNYGPSGRNLAQLIYDRGGFVTDPQPLEEAPVAPKAGRGPKPDVGLQLALIDYMRAAEAGKVHMSGALVKAMESAGKLSQPTPDARRKAVYRALDALEDEGLVKQSSALRGGWQLAQS